MLQFAMLGFLNYGPMTGYDMKRTMDGSTSNFWQAKQSQIYTTLKKLEQNGLVVSHIEPQEGSPDRRLYTITKAGIQSLQTWLEEPLTEIEQPKSKLLLKLFFSARISKEKLLLHLQHQLTIHRSQLNRYQTESRAIIEERTESSPELIPDSGLWEATRRFGELYEQTFVQWLEETIDKIEKTFD